MLASLFSLSSLKPGAGDWVDLACLVVLVIAILVGLATGFTRMLASLTAMLLALQGGYWLYPTLSHYLDRLVTLDDHTRLTALIHYLLAVFIGLAVFLLLRMLLHRFFRLLVEQPIDRIFGALTGTALGLMVLFFLFSVCSLLPAGSRTRKVICESSRTGRIFTPVVRTILEHRHASIIRFTASGKQEPDVKRGKQEPDVKRGKQTRPPARKPVPKAPAGRQRNRR